MTKEQIQASQKLNDLSKQTIIENYDNNTTVNVDNTAPAPQIKADIFPQVGISTLPVPQKIDWGKIAQNQELENQKALLKNKLDLTIITKQEYDQALEILMNN